jgi:hypothetical protein
MNEELDYAEYEERELKVEKLLTKGYQAKIRGNPIFQEHLENLDKDLLHN